ncbi:MAG TPA: HXXEE domain-containing protein [Gemmatimonadales bacterium]
MTLQPGNRPNPPGRFEMTFGALVLTQAAHSVEEYFGRLWESFPPARFLTGLISPDREIGFLVLNTALVAFGVWCLLGPVRRGRPSAVPLAWFWVTIQIINGVGHPLWSLRQGGYTPGVATAPLLLLLALYLAWQLRRGSPTSVATV